MATDQGVQSDARRMDVEEEDVRRGLQGARVTSDTWRANQALQPALEKLRAFAQRNPQRAMELWEQVVPGDPAPPDFLSRSDRGGAITEGRDRSSAEPTTSTGPQDRAQEDFFSSALNKRFLRVENQYFSREHGNSLAFVDAQSLIFTNREDTTAIHGMIDLARSKGWSSLEVTGTDAFRREVWMHASELGLQVSGYKPREEDHVALEERLRERLARAPQQEEALARSGRAPTSDFARQQDALADRGPALSPAEDQKLEQLRTYLEQDGASKESVERILEVAKGRLQKDRFYVGVLLEHGVAPYQHEKTNELSPYAVLDTPDGPRTIWGVDVPRALEHSAAKTGDVVTMEFKGRQMVKVRAPVYDDAKQVTGYEDKVVHRNAWEVQTLARMDAAERERSMQMARATAHKEATGRPLREAANDEPHEPARTFQHTLHRAAPERTR